jgi:transitional endoplasmic reticulum ATPase
MLNILSSMLPRHVPLGSEFLMSLVTRYGQRPSNMAAIARAIHMRYTNCEDLLMHDTLAQIEADVSEMARSISAASTSSALVGSSVPNVSWDDIGGLEKVKQSITEMVVWPLEKPHVFRRMGISPPLGIILHGPPGTGKTMLAKAAASASRCNFLNLSASDLMRAEFGESEKAISRAFETARALSPCLMFIDEFQSLFGNRNTAGAVRGMSIIVRHYGQH